MHHLHFPIISCYIFNEGTKGFQWFLFVTTYLILSFTQDEDIDSNLFKFSFIVSFFNFLVLSLQQRILLLMQKIDTIISLCNWIFSGNIPIQSLCLPFFFYSNFRFSLFYYLFFSLCFSFYRDNFRNSCYFFSSFKILGNEEWSKSCAIVDN